MHKLGVAPPPPTMTNGVNGNLGNGGVNGFSSTSASVSNGFHDVATSSADRLTTKDALTPVAATTTAKTEAKIPTIESVAAAATTDAKG